MGTDTGTNEGLWQGYFEHMELEMMVKAGRERVPAMSSKLIRQRAPCSASRLSIDSAQTKCDFVPLT